MILVVSPTALFEANEEQIFTCYEVRKRNKLSDPYELSREDILRQLAYGKEFRTLYRVGCRWEIGEPISSQDISDVRSS